MERKVAAQLALSVVSRELREAIYLYTGANTTRPSDIRIALTDRCNYRCVYCDHWQRQEYPSELDAEVWCAIIDELKLFVGQLKIQFAGGEPTISGAFLPVIEHCKQTDVNWGMITNGSSLRGQMLRRIIDACPMNIDISIDSSNSECHDRVRGVEGSLDRITGNLKALLLARAQSGRHFPIRIKSTVHSANYRYLTDIVAWAEAVGGVLVDFSPVRLPKGEGRDVLYVHGEECLEALRAQIENLIAMKRRGAPIETSEQKLRSFHDHFQAKPVRHGKAQCRVGLRTLDIRPDGIVHHCWRFHSAGNLTTEGPGLLWERTKRNVARKAVDCSYASTGRCGSACTTHRSLTQEIARGLRFMRRDR